MDAPLAPRSRFQEDRVGRSSWEDRQATRSFEREPEMTRAEFNAVNRLCYIIHSTLYNVLDRVPPTKRCKKERRAAKESEFSRRGMATRIFHYLKRHTDTQDQWYSPMAVFECVLEEFGRLAGSEGTQFAIPHFHFLDDQERESLGRLATRRFMSGGLQRGQPL